MSFREASNRGRDMRKSDRVVLLTRGTAGLSVATDCP